MSDSAEDRDGKLTRSIPPPLRWLPADDAPGDAPASLDTPDPLPVDGLNPVVPEPVMPDPASVEPDSEVPRVDEPAPLIAEPLAALPSPAEPVAAEPVPAEPEPEPAPVVDAPRLLAAVPDPTPSLELPPDPEPTPTVFETVTESTFTSEPEPAVAFAAEPTTPEAPGKVASIVSEHPEYLIVAALIGGFVLAKVVKKLAS